MLALACSLLALLPALAQEEDPDPVAARGNGVEVRLSELSTVLLERQGLSEQGREALDVLLKTLVLDELARARGLEIGPRAIDARWNQLDQRALSQGRPEGLLGELAQNGMSVETFRELLRLWIIQERLAKEALGIDPEDEVSAEQQEIWLQQEIAERGLQMHPPPWDDGRVASAGDVVVGREEFADFLRGQLGTDLVREAAWHLLLLRAIEARMPDLAPAARARAVEAELERRRAEHRLQHPGISFEQRLGVAGRTLAGLRRDPSVQVAALSRLWVDRTHGDEGVRRAYEADRQRFEARFGQAVRAYLIFLSAGRFVNDLNKRTFHEAEELLGQYRERIGSLEDFRALAARFSEDTNTRTREGDLGWVTRAAPGVPPELVAAAFEPVDAGRGLPRGGTMVGPARLSSGCALLWLAEVRPSPDWEVMGEHVHETLRRRFIEEVMPEGAVEVLPVAGQ